MFWAEGGSGVEAQRWGPALWLLQTLSSQDSKQRLEQQPPTFLAPGTDYVEDSVSTDPDGGMSWG